MPDFTNFHSHRIFEDPYTILDCDHSFCRKCIEDQLGKKSICPQCGLPAWRKSLQKHTSLRIIVLSVEQLLKLSQYHVECRIEDHVEISQGDFINEQKSQVSGMDLEKPLDEDSLLSEPLEDKNPEGSERVDLETSRHSSTDTHSIEPPKTPLRMTTPHIINSKEKIDQLVSTIRSISKTVQRSPLSIGWICSTCSVRNSPKNGICVLCGIPQSSSFSHGPIRETNEDWLFDSHVDPSSWTLDSPSLSKKISNSDHLLTRPLLSVTDVITFREPQRPNIGNLTAF